MRVAIVRQKYNPHGGAERFIERAMDVLATTEAVEPCVIAREWTARPGIGFIACNPPYRTSLGRDRAFAQGVLALLAAPGTRFDIVQSHERIPGLPLFRAGDGVHATWLEQRARTLPVWKRLSVAANPYHRYILEAEHAMFLHPALRAVICNSRMVRDDIAARFRVAADRLHVIQNGVDLETFHPRNAARRDATRAALDLPGEGSMFLYVGSGFERKGVSRLLDALAQVAAPAFAVIVGEDKQRKRYERQAWRLGLDKRVHFIGARGDLADLYGAADAFVLPTLYDPLPNAALEALASGLPTVTTTQCGAAELIDTGVNGYVADVLDADALAHALAALAEPGRAAAMRAAARASVLHLAPQAMAAQLMTLYRGLMAHG